jgi:zinc transporter 5/7
MLAVTVAALLSLVFDTRFSPSAVWRYLPGYGALVLHGLATWGLDHTLGVVGPPLGETFATAASVLIASIVALPLYAFKTVIVRPCFLSDSYSSFNFLKLTIKSVVII